MVGLVLSQFKDSRVEREPGFNIGSDRKQRNALFVAPKNPRSFWDFQEAVEIDGKDTVFPPAAAGLIGAMLPKNYNVKVVDLNIEELTDADLEWSDVVLTSSMIVHWRSLEEIIQRANQLERPIISGGPLPTQYSEELVGNGTFFLGEAEAGFVDVLENVVRDGYVPRKTIVDRHGIFGPMPRTPIQRFDLLKLDSYNMMSIQITRGCPEHCTFCNIPYLYGAKNRLKTSSRVIAELQSLHELGWRGSVMAVDDNIVGNQEAIIPILKDIKDFQVEHGYPFDLFGQASLRMYENPRLMEALYEAGFSSFFLGLESPSKASLKFMGAQKNLQATNERGKVPMLQKVREIQRKYFRVHAGFIIGFDSDPDDIVEMMKKFISDAGTGIAMVGPLGVLKGTPDYERYSREGRLVKGVHYGGDSGIFSRNLSFVPHDRNGNEIDPRVILDRHRDIVSHINSPKQLFKRSMDYFRNRERRPLAHNPGRLNQLPSLFRSFWRQGVTSDYKKIYWGYLLDVLKNDRKDFGDAIHHAAQGHHFIKTTREALRVDDFVPESEEAYTRFVGRAKEIYESSGRRVHRRLDLISKGAERLISDVERKYGMLNEDLRESVKNAVSKTREAARKVVADYRAIALAS